VKQRPELFRALVVTDLYVDVARNEALKYQMTLQRFRAADNGKAVTALERIGADPTQWDLRAWSTNMAWAFKTNLPIPNLDRKTVVSTGAVVPDLYAPRSLQRVHGVPMVHRTDV
jgi:hypothetical protein